MEFRILGPLEVLRGDRQVDLGGARHRYVLAMLLLGAGRPVSFPRLVQAVYDHEPPATAKAQVQICISALRRLFAAHGHDGLITTHAEGYALSVPTDSVDARRFSRRLGSARRARDAGDRETAVVHYRRALAMWHGPALQGMATGPIEAASRALDERRIAATEECINLELELGRHQELVCELLELTGLYPLREGLRALAMLALYRSGRQAEALQMYRDTRDVMVDELGMEPGERLQWLEQAILKRHATLAAPPRPAPGVRPGRPGIPRILPPDIADFTGRGKLVSEIRDHLLSTSRGFGGLAAPIVAIAGGGGVGKTALALHVAHLLTAEFSGGQLFANMHAADSQLIGPGEALEQLLLALGVSGMSVPEGVEQRAELYRSTLAERRTMVVLDNVAKESQILQLLPGTPDSAVLVTSRRRLTGLAGAVHIDVEEFLPESSQKLITRVVGQRALEAPRSTAALAELCGHLPLALRIASARLAARPHWGVEELVERLADESRRLDELHHADQDVRATLSLTYDSLGEEARRLFRRLAVLGPHPFSRWVCGALLDVPVRRGADLLDELADVHLVEIVGSGVGEQAQYHLHDLVRVFARERLVLEDPADERNAALRRVLGCLLHLTDAARQREYGNDAVVRSDAALHPLPQDVTDRLVADPMAWFGRERAMLVSGVRQAAEARLVAHCWGLAVMGVTFFESSVQLDGWRETHECALTATRRAGDRRGEAAVLYSLGTLGITRQSYADAQADLARSLELFRETGTEVGTALAVRGLGYLDRLQGRLDDAEERFDAALATFRRTGHRVASAYVLHNQAQFRMDRGELQVAEAQLTEALLLAQEGEGRRVEAQVLHRTGQLQLETGRTQQAAESFERALTIVRACGDSIGEAYLLHGTGIARLRQGDVEEAGAALQSALDLAKQMRERLVQGQALAGLGELALTEGDPEQAEDCLRQALEHFEELSLPLSAARARSLLHEAAREAGWDMAADGPR